MHVDIDSLGVFDRLAREGADRAANSLSRLTGTDATVSVTNISFLSPGDARETLAAGNYTGVRIGFGGRVHGDTVLLFRRRDANTLVDLLLPDGDQSERLARSGIKEVANIVLSGFVDGWANYLGESIDITTPTYVEEAGSQLFTADRVAGTDAADGLFLFESTLSVGDELSLELYMLPEYEAFSSLVSAQATADDVIPVDKLAAFNDMTRSGASSAAANVTTMTGVETDVEVSRIRFVPIEAVPSQVGDETVAGIVVSLSGRPSGYLAILFDEESAKSVAGSMLPTEPDDGFDGMTRSAIEEVGNVMTSGFIDGWANVLQTSIEHSPPEFVHDMGSAVMSPVVGRLGRAQDHAFLLDSTVCTDGQNIRCNIYVLPHGDELTTALRELDPERATETEANADQFF
jgi:chemotaxis protein CheY-P-specific phosphatase CheC